MKITCQSFDKNDRDMSLWYPFYGNLDTGNCLMSADGGVTITFWEEDEFGYSKKQVIQLSPDDIKLINKTKL